MLIQITTVNLALMLSSKLKVLIAFYSPTGVCQTLANCSVMQSPEPNTSKPLTLGHWTVTFQCDVLPIN